MFNLKHSMVFKTLTIKGKVYEKLIRAKHEGESFSDLLERLAEKEQPDLMKYFGSIPMTDEEAEKRLALYRRLRKDSTASFWKRQARMHDNP